jgi:hypothetical protein
MHGLHMACSVLIIMPKVVTGKTIAQTSFATVVTVEPGDLINTTTLRERIAQFTNIDDVFDKAFLEGIIFQGAEMSEIKVDLTPTGILKEWGVEWTHFQTTSMSSSLPPPPLGPYVVKDGQLFQIWRLYNDDNLAFLQSVWPSINSPGYVYCARCYLRKVTLPVSTYRFPLRELGTEV